MTEHIDILVCNSQDVLDHKLRDGKKSNGAYCYWGMSRFPRRLLDIVDILEVPETTGVVSESAKAPGSWVYDDSDILFPEGVDVRLYFAIKGWVRGYFLCNAMGERNGTYELRFYSESWTPIQPVSVKPSRGFRYFKGAG